MKYALLVVVMLVAQPVLADNPTIDEASDKRVFAELLSRLFPERDTVTVAHVDSFIVAYGQHAKIANPTKADLGADLRSRFEAIWSQYVQWRKSQQDTTQVSTFPESEG